MSDYHRLEAGQFVTAAGFVNAHRVFGPMSRKGRFASAAAFIEDQLNRFPAPVLAGADGTLSFLTDDKMANAARAVELTVAKQNAVVLAAGDRVAIDGYEFDVVIHGEGCSTPIEFRRQWPKVENGVVDLAMGKVVN